MRRRHLLLAGLAAASTGLAACGGARQPQPLPDFSAEQPLRLMVADLAVDAGYPPLPQANFIDERRTRDLAEAAASMLRSRLVAAGGTASARVSLPQASLTERLRTDRAGGVKGLLTREPAYDLEATVTVRVAIVDSAGTELAWSRAGVGRSRSLRAGTSAVERDNAARALIADLLPQLDSAVTQAVRDNLAAWLG